MHEVQEGYNQLVIQPVLPKTRSQFTMSPGSPGCSREGLPLQYVQ
jgi:hypothetical protein